MEINPHNINYWNKHAKSENLMKAVNNYKKKRNTVKGFKLMQNYTKNSKKETEVALKKADNYKKKRNTSRGFKLMKNNTKNSKNHKASLKAFRENWRRKRELKTRPPQILEIKQENQNIGKAAHMLEQWEQSILKLTIEIYRNPDYNDYIQSIIEFIRENKNHIIQKTLDGISIQNRKQFKDICSKYGIDLSVHDLLKISDKTIDELEVSLLNIDIKNNHSLYGFRTFVDTIKEDERGEIYIYLKPTLNLPIITRSNVEYDAGAHGYDPQDKIEDLIFNTRMNEIKRHRTQKKWNNNKNYNMKKLSMHEPTHFANLL